MRFSPFRERPSNAALMRHVKLRGETADIVQNEKATGRQRTVPKVQFSEGGLVFVRAVKNDQFRIAAQVILRRDGRLRIE